MYVFLQTKESTGLEKSEVEHPTYRSVDSTGIQNPSFVPEDEHQSEKFETDIKA
jgi:hypothetical protein